MLVLGELTVSSDANPSGPEGSTAHTVYQEEY
jgi:hypothetical protein